MLGVFNQLDAGLLASLVAAFVSTVGLVSMAMLGDWGRRHSSYFSAFAIGVLSVAVFYHLIPDALSESLQSWRAVIAGFLGMSIFGLLLRLLTRKRIDGELMAFGYASIIALGFHSLLDGVIYATSYHDHLFTGGLTTFGLLLHEFPEGVIAYFLLRSAGLSNLQSSIWAFIAASLTTVIGAVLANLYIDTINSLPFPAILGGTAGALLYVMVFHLGPHARLTPNKRGYDFAAYGVIVAILAVILRHFE